MDTSSCCAVASTVADCEAAIGEAVSAGGSTVAWFPTQLPAKVSGKKSDEDSPNMWVLAACMEFWDPGVCFDHPWPLWPFGECSREGKILLSLYMYLYFPRSAYQASKHIFLKVDKRSSFTRSSP